MFIKIMELIIAESSVNARVHVNSQHISYYILPNNGQPIIMKKKRLK